MVGRDESLVVAVGIEGKGGECGGEGSGSHGNCWSSGVGVAEREEIRPLNLGNMDDKTEDDVDFFNFRF